MEENNIYKIFLVIIIIGLISSNSSNAVFMNSTFDDWVIETVNNSDDFWDNQIKIDSNNNPHICYWKQSSNPSEQQLKYSYKSNGNWNSEVVDDSSHSGAGCSISLDSNNNPHISYQSGDSGLSLYYAYKDSSGWIIEEVDEYGVSSYTSIDLDSYNNPHIAFYDCVEEGLCYASKQNNEWTVEIVDFIDDGDGVGLYPSIKLDYNNKPHISYYDSVNNNLKYALKNSGSWNIENVDTNDCGQFTSISVDSNNNPHISYRKSSILKYAYKNSCNWNVEVVDDSYNQPVISPTSITIDSNDNPHICYYHDDAYNCLKYAVKKAGTWDLDVILNDVDQYCDINLDNSNNPHISFTDSKILKYAYKEGDNPDNNPPVAYIDDINPNPSEEGETVSFQGHGTDSDGSIIAYNWRSSIDGQLSTEASFSKSDLSEGTHTIYFKVKDNQNAWSSEKSQTLVVGNGGDDPDYVPVWSKGNEWNYNFNFEFLYSGVIEINGAINPMKLVVTEVNEEDNEYKLKITGYINADLTLFGFLPGGGFSGDVKGDVKIDRSTLAMKDFIFEADGSYLGFDTHAITTMNFNPAFDIFDFPIEPTEDVNNPWTAETFSELCIDFWAGVIHQDACIDGGFDDEELHYVREENHKGYDCILFSGNMGPSHGGSSKLWYSEDAGYLVDIQESIYGWQGVDATLNMPLISTNYDASNHPPLTPNKPTGETIILTGEEYTFTSSSEDEEGDSIYYMFEWGDGQRSEWLGPYASEQSVSASHIWLKTGSYNIRVKAKDIEGLETSWSDPLVVTVNSETPVVTVFIHRFDKIDEIDYPYLWDPLNYLPEWYYRVKVKSTDGTTSDDFYYCTEDGTQYTQYISGDGWQPDREHELICTSSEVIVSIKAMDHDQWYELGDDIWDISGCSGDGEDNSVSDTGHRGAIYHGTYNLITDSFKPYSSKPSDYADKIHNQNGYLVSSGEYKPDSSTGYDGNDATVQFWVSDSYEPPTASITDPPTQERVDHEIDFIGGVTDGFATKDDPYDWLWNFGDGSTSTKQNPSHTYSSKGTYTVSLTVTDGFDQKDTVEATIKIIANNAPNKPDAPSGQSKGKVRKTHTFSCVTTDPEEDNLYYKFDWGDGTYSDWIGTYESGETASLSHSWDKMGSYNVRVKAKDIYHDESEWSNPTPIQMSKYSDNIIIRMFQRIIDMFPFTENILQPIIENIEQNLENNNNDNNNNNNQNPNNSF